MVGILELGDLVPEHVPVRINRIVEESLDGPDGVKVYKTQPIVLQAYKYGPRCPVLVKATLHQVSKRFREDVDANGFSDVAFQIFARDSFLALIPGMSLDEADLLASDDEEKNGLCIKTLKYIGYWKENPATEVESDDPEVKAETDQNSTIQESSPISA